MYAASPETSPASGTCPNQNGRRQRLHSASVIGLFRFFGFAPRNRSIAPLRQFRFDRQHRRRIALCLFRLLPRQHKYIRYVLHIFSPGSPSPCRPDPDRSSAPAAPSRPGRLSRHYAKRPHIRLPRYPASAAFVWLSPGSSAPSIGSGADGAISSAISCLDLDPRDPLLVPASAIPPPRAHQSSSCPCTQNN